MKTTAIALICAVLVVGATNAKGQTLIGQAPVNFQDGNPSPNQAPNQAPDANAVGGQPQAFDNIQREVPPSSINQANQHLQGDYGELVVDSYSAGQIQNAWDNVGVDAGIHEVEYCVNVCTYRLRGREFMQMAIKLPNDFRIITVDAGDPQLLKLGTRGDNILMLTPIDGVGKDTSLHIIGENGDVIVFYLRIEGVNSPNLPDLLFSMRPETTLNIPVIEPPKVLPEDQLTQDVTFNETDSLSSVVQSGDASSVLQKSGDSFGDISITKADWEELDIDPFLITNVDDYKLYGSRYAHTLRPLKIVRDNKFTYLFYPKNYGDSGLPIAETVRNGRNEQVNVRTYGAEKWDVLVIESIQSRLTLKFGTDYLCLVHKGSGASDGSS